jgi:ElaB/YqjD/DUF883 family membrane-anchored ribosome-binding protein
MSVADAGAERDEEVKHPLSEINKGLEAIRKDLETIAASSTVNSLSTQFAELKSRFQSTENAVSALSEVLNSISKNVADAQGAANDAKTALDDSKKAIEKAVQQIPGSFPWWFFAALLAFGIVLGILTVLSTASGISTTLIGLLAALIGGSLLTWFQPAQLPGDKLSTMAFGVLGLSIGCLVGGAGGFILKLHDPLVDVSGQQSTEAAMHLRDAAAAAADAARNNLLQSVYSRAQSVIVADPADSDPTIKRVSGLLQAVSTLRTADSSAGTKGNELKPIYVLNDAQMTELQQAADDLDRSLSNFKPGDKEKEQLDSLQKKSGKLMVIILKLNKPPK